MFYIIIGIIIYINGLLSTTFLIKIRAIRHSMTYDNYTKNKAIEWYNENSAVWMWFISIFIWPIALLYLGWESLTDAYVGHKI